jgi:hypothetical protein
MNVAGSKREIKRSLYHFIIEPRTLAFLVKYPVLLATEVNLSEGGSTGTI